MNVFQRYSYLKHQIKALNVNRAVFSTRRDGFVTLTKSDTKKQFSPHDIVKKLVIPYPVTEHRFSVALHEIGHIHNLVPYQQHWGVGWYLILFSEIAAWQWAIEQGVLSERIVSYALNNEGEGLASYIACQKYRLSEGLSVHTITPQLNYSAFRDVLDCLDEYNRESIDKWFDVVNVGKRRKWEEERGFFVRDLISQYEDADFALMPFASYLRAVAV